MIMFIFYFFFFFFFSSRRRHTRFDCDWSSDVCSSDLQASWGNGNEGPLQVVVGANYVKQDPVRAAERGISDFPRSEEHTSELQSQSNLVCRLLLEKKKNNILNRQRYHV